MNDFPTTESKKAMFVLVATARMTQAGLSISEVADRLKKVGYSAGSALRLAEDGAQAALDHAAKISAGRIPGAPPMSRGSGFARRPF